MRSNPKHTITLKNGVLMPALGLGTWKMNDDEACAAVRIALEIGYRHFDTASLYGNERGVGKAVRESGVLREDVFVTTKLLPHDFGNPKEALEESLSKLGLEYVDLYLIHWPIPAMEKSVWRAMEKLYEDKKTRAIGVSNYGIGDIEKLLEYARIPPAVNQIRFSPFDFEQEIMKCCRANGIVVEAYSPLTQGVRLDDPTISTIAKKYGKTAAQIMIRWCIEHGVAVVPKSTHKSRIEENADVFDFQIAAEDMHILDTLS